MTETSDLCEACGKEPAECGCERRQRFRLVPPPAPQAVAAVGDDVEVGPVAATRLVREYKGPTVAELQDAGVDVQALPSLEDGATVVPGPGYERRRAWVLLWPLLVVMVGVVVASTVIALS